MASTILVNTIDAQSGSTISIPTGKTLAITDAGGLTVAGTTIESGNVSVNTISSTPTNLGTGAEVAMWTGKNKAIFMVDASGGDRVVQLPAPDATGRSTVSIVIAVKACNDAITPYMVTINNSSGTEVFTLYAKGDHVEFVSDGTNDLRTGSEHISAGGHIHRTSNLSIAQGSYSNLMTSGACTLTKDWGNLFDNVTDFRLDIPYPCTVRLTCFVTNQATTGATSLFPQLQRFYSSGSSSEFLFRQSNHTASPYGFGNHFVREFDLTTGDEAQFDGYVVADSSAQTAAGSSNSYESSFGAWEIVRRY